ncbi:MAG: hypothetical protein WBF50_05970 [Pseudolabrys sp.]
MRRGHKKKRKASVLCLKLSDARDCISGKSGGSRGRKCVLVALTILSHVAAIIGTIAVILDALHRW